MLNQPKKLLPLLIIAAIGPAQASDTSGNTVLTLGTMEVQASEYGSLTSQQILTSVDILDRSLIENKQVKTTWELFSLLPGVTVTSYGQGSGTGEFAIRGFNTEGEINAVKILLDGVPSNVHSGNMDYLDMVPSLDIESIELVRGTNDPRYGLHNIAGNANVTTRLGGNYKDAQVSMGSFDTYNLQAAAGFQDEQFSQNYSVAYVESGGYRDRSEFDKVSLSGKWFVTPDNTNYSLGLIARWHESDANSPGYLLKEDSRISPSSSYDYNDGDYTDQEMGQLSAHLDVDLSDSLFWSFKTYINSFDSARLVQWRDGDPKQRSIYDEIHYGALSSMTYRMSDVVTFEGGMDIHHEENESERQISSLRDQTFDLTTYGAYVQSVVRPTTWLKLVPGVRVDSIKGDFKDRLTNIRSSINDYDAIWQPKFSAVITPIEGYNLYANWGRTFQIGVEQGAYHESGAPSLEPSINEGWEVGVKFKPVHNFEGRIAYWEQDASDEIRRKFDGSGATGDGENIGETERRGIDVQANWQIVEPLLVWAAYSWQEAIIKNPGSDPGLAATKGQEIDHTPSYLISAGVSYQITPKLSSTVTAYAQGDYYIEKTNEDGQIDDYYLLDLAFDYQLNAKTNLNLQFKNLTNQYHEYAWYWGGTTGSFHTPGDKRAIYGTISHSFD